MTVIVTIGHKTTRFKGLTINLYQLVKVKVIWRSRSCQGCMEIKVK